LIGDYSPDVRAHRAIPRALELACRNTGFTAEPHWLPTTELGPDTAAALAACDGLWCVPGSPYAHMDGALCAIRYAREHGRPFLGTCGGFQHALIEYARHVKGLIDADHAESNPSAAVPLIAPLACSLVGAQGVIRLHPGSAVARIYGKTETVEQYHCNYALNPRYRPLLEEGPLHVTGTDEAGDARVIELDGHPFFLATLFQPELAALDGVAHPLPAALIRAAARQRRDLPAEP
jgi:CTP synthase (UTP-ammonia lyase)